MVRFFEGLTKALVCALLLGGIFFLSHGLMTATGKHQVMPGYSVTWIRADTFDVFAQADQESVFRPKSLAPGQKPVCRVTDSHSSDGFNYWEVVGPRTHKTCAGKRHNVGEMPGAHISECTRYFPVRYCHLPPVAPSAHTAPRYGRVPRSGVC
jgi:hypothetical protein